MTCFSYWVMTAGENPALGIMLMMLGWFSIVPLLLVKIGKLRCTLVVDKNEIRYHEKGRRKQRRMALDQLEMLRVNSALHESLNWMSDKQVEKIPMAKEIAQWLKHGVESWLIERILRHK